MGIKAIIFDIHGTLIQPGLHKPFDGMAQLLPRLSDQYKLAYATSWSASRVEELLGEYDLLKYFSVQVYDSEVQNGKPSADVYLEAAKRLGCEAAECVVVEDGESCIESAKAAGFLTIAHKPRYNVHATFEMADHVVEDLLDIEKINLN